MIHSVITAAVAFLLLGCACELRGPASTPGYDTYSPLELTEEVEAAARVALTEVDSMAEFRKVESATSFDQDGQDFWILKIATQKGSIWRAALNRSGDSEFKVVSVQEVYRRVGVFQPYGKIGVIE